MIPLPRGSRARLLRSLALDRGFATAEFAMVLPAVFLMGVMILWVLSLFITQIQIQSASYLIARDVARNQMDIYDPQKQLPADFEVHKTITNNLVTVKVSVHKSLLNQRVPCGVDLSAVSIAELERLSVDQASQSY